MRLSEVEKRAKAVGINDTWKFSKKELIRNIQRTEGNHECFGSLKVGQNCVHSGCCWRDDCLK